MTDPYPTAKLTTSDRPIDYKTMTGVRVRRLHHVRVLFHSALYFWYRRGSSSWMRCDWDGRRQHYLLDTMAKRVADDFDPRKKVS
jgi:hypothetical protein